MVETAREIETEVEPKYMTIFLESHNEILMDIGLLLRDEQRKYFRMMKSTLVKMS
jgi:superfamily I DNA and RNA helicase